MSRDDGVMGAGFAGASRSCGSSNWPQVAATIIILLSAGCRPLRSSEPSPTSPGTASDAQETAEPTIPPLALPTPWRVEFNRSGGIAGEMKTISISDDGSFVATDKRLDGSLERTISTDEVDEIGRLLAEIYPFPPVRRGGECRDCFLYMIRLDLGGRVSEITLDDGTLPNSGFERLAARLNTILDRELSGG